MDIKKLKPNIRYLVEMKELLFDKEWAKTVSDLELYYMYRDLADSKKDKQTIIKQELRYDITVIPFIMLGQEYNKTAGHDHPLVPKTNLTYSEIYEVLEGKAIFLFQDSHGSDIKNVYAVKAKKNDKVIVLPNYEHLIINASGEILKTANWVCRDFSSNIYKPFRKKCGFCYFALKNDSQEINWVKNGNYNSIPNLEFMEPNKWLEKFEIDKEKSLYSLVKNLKKLDFLKNPKLFKDLK
ncbi:MAG: glucose-6-phosphate isomerase [Parcubacteria group bacterium]|nr:glucose-6-phosphate isomerase [Parcubacteria group bacterium]